MEKNFSNLHIDQGATLYTITGGGLSAVVSDLGATLVRLMAPDAAGNVEDVVLGYDTAKGYLEGTSFLGATVGRSANRIAGASFSLNGKTYAMTANEGRNNLHSGPDCYHLRLWAVQEQTENAITLTLLSPDGDQGMPGTAQFAVTYRLDGDGGLHIIYDGLCDQDTIFNMTNHSYFNLGGHDSGNVYEQTIQLNATTYTPVSDSKSIPTGEIAPVAGTPMDFTEPKAIGKEIDADFAQLQMTGGYDHNFVLDKPEGAFDWMAKAYCEKTGIAMEAHTDCPAVQFYAANFLNNEKGKNGAVYGERHAFCLESQYCPNAVNDTHFAQPFLKAGEKYDTKTVYRFLVK